MQYYNRDPKKDPTFDNHPCGGESMLESFLFALSDLSSADAVGRVRSTPAHVVQVY